MRRRNVHINGTSRLAYRIAGSERKFYALPPEERKTIRDTARQMYELGVDFTTADKAEKTDRRGFVYVITNPAWPGYVKIGRAFDPEARARSMNTGCPLNDYEVCHAVYFHDCYWAEREVHERLAESRLPGGEWFALPVHVAVHSIEKLRETV